MNWRQLIENIVKLRKVKRNKKMMEMETMANLTTDNRAAKRRLSILSKLMNKKLTTE